MNAKLEVPRKQNHGKRILTPSQSLICVATEQPPRNLTINLSNFHILNNVQCMTVETRAKLKDSLGTHDGCKITQSHRKTIENESRIGRAEGRNLSDHIGTQSVVFHRLH